MQVSHISYSTSQKFGHTHSFKGFSSTLWNNTWNHVVTKKLLNKSKYILYLTFFKVATLCLDDSFAHSWYSLNQLHEECFSNSLEGVLTCAEHLLAAFPSLHGPTHPKPSQLGWGWVIVEARSSDAALHHSPWSNSLKQPWGVFWVIVLLKNKW